MPRLSVWFIRMALVHLLIGFTLGALLLVQKGALWFPWIWRFLPVHIDLVLLGWMGQLAMGVAFWILPRFGFERRREWLAAVSWIGINCGLVLLFIAAWEQMDVAVWFVARTLEVLGVFGFVLHAWPRVKPTIVSTETSSPNI